MYEVTEKKIYGGIRLLEHNDRKYLLCVLEDTGMHNTIGEKECVSYTRGRFIDYYRQ